jgi:O-succinylbenzoate synthase
MAWSDAFSFDSSILLLRVMVGGTLTNSSTRNNQEAKATRQAGVDAVIDSVIDSDRRLVIEKAADWFISLAQGAIARLNSPP